MMKIPQERDWRLEPEVGGGTFVEMVRSEVRVEKGMKRF